MTEVKQNSEAKIADLIEETLVLCAADVSILRTKIIAGAPGPLESDFYNFRENFDFLFTLSGSYKEIDKDMKTKIEKWINSMEEINANNIMKAIKLFNDYKDDLFKNSIVVK